MTSSNPFYGGVLSEFGKTLRVCVREIYSVRFGVCFFLCCCCVRVLYRCLVPLSFCPRHLRVLFSLSVYKFFVYVSSAWCMQKHREILFLKTTKVNALTITNNHSQHWRWRWQRQRHRQSCSISKQLSQ